MPNSINRQCVGDGVDCAHGVDIMHGDDGDVAGAEGVDDVGGRAVRWR